jgi:hypothetical protein
MIGLYVKKLNQYSRMDKLNLNEGIYGIHDCYLSKHENLLKFSNLRENRLVVGERSTACP